MKPNQLKILIRGAGQVGSAIALRLHQAGFYRLCLIEQEQPSSIFRSKAFADTVYNGVMTIENLTAALISHPKEVYDLWAANCIALIVDPKLIKYIDIKYDICIDTSSDPDLGFSNDFAGLIINIGSEGKSVANAHYLVGKLSPYIGKAIKNSAQLPKVYLNSHHGNTNLQYIYSPQDGLFKTSLDIGDYIYQGNIIGKINKETIFAPHTGSICAILKDYTHIKTGLRLAQIVSKNRTAYYSISERSLSIAGGVLEIICSYFNKFPSTKHGVLILP